MKRVLRFPSLTPAPGAQIATSRRTLTGAFELVYRSYLAKGYIRPHPGRIVYRRVFSLPSSCTIVTAAADAEITGTLTLVGDNPLGLQLEATYPREVQSLRDQGRKVAEVTCLAIESACGFRPTFFNLTELMIHFAYLQEYDDLLIAVHPRHYRFYWRHFRVFPLGPCRPHGAVGGNPAICCRIELHYLGRNMEPELWEQYFSGVRPERHYTGQPIMPEDHLYFCNRRGISPDTDSNAYTIWHKDAA